MVSDIGFCDIGVDGTCSGECCRGRTDPRGQSVLWRQESDSLRAVVVSQCVRELPGFQGFVQIVLDGRKVQGRIQYMPGWRGVLSQKDIYEIGAYVETLAIEGANWK
jgi:hypothetical protein